MAEIIIDSPKDPGVEANVHFYQLSKRYTDSKLGDALNSANYAAQSAARAEDKANQMSVMSERAEQAANDAIDAADRANAAANAAELAVEDVLEAIESQDLGFPESMTVEYPHYLTLGNKENNKIVATLYPLATALQNVLFLSDNNAVSVYPDGTIHINKAGRSVVHVVPTMKTSLYRTLLITVLEQSVRLTKTNSVRLLSGGTFRLN